MNRPRFRLSTLLLTAMVICVTLAWWIERAKRVEAVKELDRSVPDAVVSIRVPENSLKRYRKTSSIATIGSLLIPPSELPNGLLHGEMLCFGPDRQLHAKLPLKVTPSPHGQYQFGGTMTATPFPIGQVSIVVRCWWDDNEASDMVTVWVVE